MDKDVFTLHVVYIQTYSEMPIFTSNRQRLHLYMHEKIFDKKRAIDSETSKFSFINNTTVLQKSRKKNLMIVYKNKRHFFLPLTRLF